MIKSLATAAAAILALSEPSFAGTDSRITYYPVSGASAKAVYESIREGSPKIAPNAIFAFTAIATKTSSKLNKAGGRCAYASFKTAGFYVYYLPLHHAPSSMPDQLQAKWGNFVEYLLTHEQGHRDIWQGCLAEYDQQTLQLSASTCEDLDRKRESTFNSIKQGCVGQDEAYDVEFRKDVRKHPFVAEALQGTESKSRSSKRGQGNADR